MTITQQEIIALAEQAGMTGLSLVDIGFLERFAALAAAHERNACLAEIETGIWLDKTTDEALADIAEAIRARSAE